MNAPLAVVDRVKKRYNGLLVLDEVSMDIDAGKIVSLIGPNGAGKTTLFNVITGIEKPEAGRVVMTGAEITGCSPVTIANRGVARSFQTCQVFHNLTVIDNVMLGRYMRTSVGFFMAGLRLPPVYREEHRNMSLAFEALDYFGLYDKADRKMSQISSLEQRLVEIARCLAMRPELLLLDEPFGGLGETEIGWLSEKLCCLRDQGMTLMVVDHHFNSIASISDEIAVLHQGRIIAKGRPDEIKRHGAVIRAYLGG